MCLPRFARDETELNVTSGFPSASIETFAPPLVMSLIASIGFSFFALTPAVAPIDLANSNFSSEISTAIVLHQGHLRS